MSVIAFFAFFICGNFADAYYEGSFTPASSVSEFWLCVFGVIFELGQFFCLWFVYFRKPNEYIRISGYSDKEIKKIEEEFLK